MEVPLSRFVLALLVGSTGCAGNKTVEQDTPSAEPAPVVPQPEKAAKIAGSRAAPRPEHAGRATAFALALHRELTAKGGNSVSSGPSAMVAFSMLGAGAKGKALDELGAMLGGPLDEAWHVDNERLLAAWNDTPGVQLAAANALWVDDGETLAPAYVKRVGDAYGTAPANLPFSTDPAAAADRIDAWSTERTFGMIPKLLPADDLTGVSLVLANAIAFKGTWKVKFPVEGTRPAPFLVASAPVDVPTMNVELTARHTDGDGWSALVLPYDGEGMSMLVLLPDADKTLADLDRALTAQMLGELMEGAPQKVRLALPKFTFAVSHDLTPPVIALGAPSVFGGGDFTEMGLGPMDVDKAIQKAFIQVDEQGTEAAAVTVVTMKRSAVQAPESVKFQVDRPFLFAIWHHETQVPLFLGRVDDPRG